jgi:hypothetical protein
LVGNHYPAFAANHESGFGSKPVTKERVMGTSESIVSSKISMAAIAVKASKDKAAEGAIIALRKLVKGSRLIVAQATLTMRCAFVVSESLAVMVESPAIINLTRKMVGSFVNDVGCRLNELAQIAQHIEKSPRVQGAMAAAIAAAIAMQMAEMEEKEAEVGSKKKAKKR